MLLGSPLVIRTFAGIHDQARPVSASIEAATARKFDPCVILIGDEFILRRFWKLLGCNTHTFSIAHFGFKEWRRA
jgi:hypothetical protein